MLGKTSRAATRKVPRPQVGSRIEVGRTPRPRSKKQTALASSIGVWKSPNSALDFLSLTAAISLSHSDQSIYRPGQFDDPVILESPSVSVGDCQIPYLRGPP